MEVGPGEPEEGVVVVVSLNRSLDPLTKNLLFTINFLNIFIYIMNHWFAFLLRKCCMYYYLVSFRGFTFRSVGESVIFMPLIGDCLSLSRDTDDLMGMEGL